MLDFGSRRSTIRSFHSPVFHFAGENGIHAITLRLQAHRINLPNYPPAVGNLSSFSRIFRRINSEASDPSAFAKHREYIKTSAISDSIAILSFALSFDAAQDKSGFHWKISNSSADSTTIAAARSFGLWKCSQSRALENSKTSAWSSDKVICNNHFPLLTSMIIEPVTEFHRQSSLAQLQTRRVAFEGALAFFLAGGLPDLLVQVRLSRRKTLH